MVELSIMSVVVASLGDVVEAATADQVSQKSASRARGILLVVARQPRIARNRSMMSNKAATQ